jgi:hypothetical protein
VWSHIIWDYFHEGIPVHYILHNPNLPGIPNWVGAIVLPFFTWILLHRIHIRINRPKIVTIPASIKNVALRFFASALVAVTIAICFMNDINAIDYIMGSLFILAFIFPIYKSEFLLGWVVGSSFTFGAMLPIVFGSLIAGIFFLLYKIPRKILSYFTLKKE